jgi:hypothetical protein
MFAIVGTVPDEDFPVSCGPIEMSGHSLKLENQAEGQTGTQTMDIARGTPALLAAAAQVCRFFGAPPPYAYLAGDIGRGRGSRNLYKFLETRLPACCFSSLTFHYVQPDVDWHNRILFAIEKMHRRPVLIADAGFMYAAKMSGQAEAYDVFTPDIGELAFLADAEAPHPFYTRGFIFHESNRVPDLINSAYKHNNAARFLMVKGETDILADGTGQIAAVSDPLVPALEAIGGTGDILTGLLSAFIGLEKDIRTACVLAAQVSRMAGKLANPDPGTQVMEIIAHIPTELKELNIEYQPLT